MAVLLGHGTCQLLSSPCHLSNTSSSSSREALCYTVSCRSSIGKSSKPHLKWKFLQEKRDLLEGCFSKPRIEAKQRIHPGALTRIYQPQFAESKLGRADKTEGTTPGIPRPELEHSGCISTPLKGLCCENRKRDLSNCGYESREDQPAAPLVRRDFLLLASSAAFSAAYLAGTPLVDLPAAHAFLEEDPVSGATGTPGAFDVRGRHVIITGGNSGIGKATAVELARRGMHIVLACRSQERGEAAAADIISQTGNTNVRAMICDLASLRSVRQFASDYIQTGRPLHVLVNNAGVMAAPKMYTEDGFELQFGTNHIGHFALTSLLMDTLVDSASQGLKSRVVVVSSKAEQLGSIDFSDLNFDSTRKYNPWAAYAQSKLANVLFANELARRCEARGVPITANSMHPGVVDTELIRYVLPPKVMEARANAGSTASKFARLIGLKSPEEGAATVVYLAASAEMEGRTGGFYDNLKLELPSSNARNDALAEQLWTRSEELTGAIFSLDMALSTAI